MPYNVAANLRISTPDPIGVDQLKRKNALADMAAQTDQNRNALYAQQISQNQARMKADEQEAALERVRQWAPGAIAQARAGQIAPFVVAGQQLGVIDPQRDPATVTADEVEEFATQLGIGPVEKPAPITLGGQGGYSYLEQGGKPVPGSVQAPQRSSQPDPVRPNWQRFEIADPKTGQAQVGVINMNAPNPEATFRPMGAAPKPANSSNPQSMRKEFDSQDSVKNYRSALTQYRRATTAPDTRAGDISVVYALGKIFDPQSVVREGELTLSQNAQPWLQKIVGEANSQVSRTGRLDAATRSEIVGAMKGQIDSMGEAYSSDFQRFSQYAQDAGFDPYSVVGGNLYTPEPQQKPAQAAAPPKGKPFKHSSGATVTILE